LNPNPLVTFIVPAFNSEKTISDCIKSILAQNIEKEIIVIDNDSSDSTVKIINRYPVRYILEIKRGPAAAKNKGLDTCNQTSRYIAFIDSDVILPEEWAEKAVTFLDNDKDVAGVGGPGKSITKNYVSEIFDYLLYGKTSEQKMLYVNSLATMDVMYKREAIKDLYFNEKLIAAEDPDFNFRILNKNYKLMYFNELWVYHHNPTTLKEIWKKWYNYGKYYPLPYFWNNRIHNLGLWLRILYFPLLLCLIIFSVFYKEALPFLIIFMCILPLAYIFIGLKTGLRSVKKLVLFSFLHSFKQFVQVIGIWIGFIKRITLVETSKK